MKKLINDPADVVKEALLGIEAAHPDLRIDFPPLKSLSNFRQNLPVQLTSFIGREHDRATVREHIDQHRLVTLTGSGGCGKTRLAIQVGADALEQFPDGVRFVDLAPLSDPSLVLDAIAAAVDVKVPQDLSTQSNFLWIAPRPRGRALP